MHCAILDIDLTAISANYRLLKSRHAKQAVASVVKADAYGLGMEAVSKRLWDEGCHDFFVATLNEGITLRALLPDARIGVFAGLLSGEEKDYRHHRLLPVLNELSQLERAGSLPFVIHIDTGMTRLGLSLSDLKKASPLTTANCQLVMSHLACAGEPEHAKNAEQLARFREALPLLPNVPASLANSSGIFLSPEFHFDLARPGCALYGINPTKDANPMQQVAHLSAPILQIRTLDRDETVGYNATHRAAKGGRIAVVGLGYADGWMRSLSNKSYAYIAGYKVPVIGIISMDMLALDVSALRESALGENSVAEFINAEQTVDDIALQCNTIGYEILTRIGHRVQRRYRTGKL